MSQQFQKKREGFQCGHCGAIIEGNGYTNHCPKCLWSRHVDNNPGDRSARCGGMMKPAGFEQKHGALRIQHQCERCGYKKPNKISKQDDIAFITNTLQQL